MKNKKKQKMWLLTFMTIFLALNMLGLSENVRAVMGLSNPYDLLFMDSSTQSLCLLSGYLIISMVVVRISTGWRTGHILFVMNMMLVLAIVSNVLNHTFIYSAIIMMAVFKFIEIGAVVLCVRLCICIQGFRVHQHN